MSRTHANERLRQAVLAIGLALVIGASTLLRPLDITVWSLQAKLFQWQPSDDIALIDLKYGDGAQNRVEHNRQLLFVLRSLESSDVELIALDIPVQRSSSAQLDAALRQVMQDNRDRLVLTRTVSEDSDRYGQIAKSDQYFENGMTLASNDYYTDFLGYVWGIKSQYQKGDQIYPSLWSVLAGASSTESYDLSIDYGVNSASFTKVNISDDQPNTSARLRALDGKKVIIETTQEIRTPNGAKVGAATIHALAAESYSLGHGVSISSYIVLFLFSLVLIVGLATIRTDKSRYKFYVLWLLTLPASVVFSAYTGFRAGFAEVIALALIYAILRIVSRYKRRHLLFEPRSKLPNFVALRRDLEDTLPGKRDLVAVAKIARLDAVFTTLTPGQQGQYLSQIAKRLALGDKAKTIYYDGGKYFAFVLDRSHVDDIEDHLLGLRAIASQAVKIDGRLLDVSMTIGVDESSEGATPSNRLSAAVASADQAREAYRPVFVITDAESDTEQWDYSLQARLEEALEQDRIAIALQPQADLAGGQIVAAESLARWIDRKRGDVPPSQFISQCERVGRLDELTKRVLAKTLAATNRIQSKGLDARVALNVSAIQFVDDRIVDILEAELGKHVVDPTKLTIEVTETARIEDYRAARDIIERIKKMGPEFAIDDFGVGSANFEALSELPFDEIKIDRHFVDRLTKSRTARSIVSSLINLTRDGEFIAVAEGIEDRETFDILREMGCNRGQGYHIGRPQQLDHFIQCLEMQREQWNFHKGLG